MTTDPTPLQERIARELYARGNDELRKAWDNPRNLHQVPQWREKYRELSAAVLPLIAAEVRKAQADVLRDAAADMGEWADEPILVTGDATDEDTWTSQTVGEWLHVRAEQIEKETPDA